MKNTILLFLIALFSVNLSIAQEWMTSLDVAKRLAFVQDKMLFVMWEESTEYSFPVQVNDDKGVTIITDLFKDENINKIIWDHFIPVKIPEYKHEALFDLIKSTSTSKYINKFNDDSVKIMDVNGNILNVNASNIAILNLEKFIHKYGLNTSFLKGELKNYRYDKSFYTAFRLASKYLDFSVFVNSLVRIEVIKLSEIYFKEADEYLLKSDLKRKEAFMQKSALLKLKKFLILNKPRKVLRELKKFSNIEINSINESLLAFLYYTSYRLINDENNTGLWKSKLSSLDLKYANLIFNINS